ncbi:MAG: hypothetical protein J6O62_03180 [Bacilli bacterium]|nr:hypothetical protein [Bacilli bacterium]MBO6195728.1 hypothetical protein [Bacilli bacterium]
MKRSIKNIIMIIIIILLSVGMFFTTKYLKPVTQNSTMSQMGTPPTMPSSDNNSNSSQNTPPEKPSDDSSSEKSSDNSSQNTPPQMPTESNLQSDNSSVLFYVLIICEGLALASIISYLISSKFNLKTRKETFENGDKIVIYVLLVTLLTTSISSIPILLNNKENSNNSQNNQMNQESNATYSAKEEITEDKTITSGSYSSTTKDENAILTTGDIKVNISNVEVSKTGDSNGGDNTSFYGTNSAILAKSGAILTLKNITVNTNATGANGVFSYGGSATTSNSSSDGTTVNISDSTITTTKDNSGGIMTTGGGVMNANNLTINTSGISSAAIRSDRGGGDVTVNKGTYTTTGQGSPAIYSTANIKVSNAKLISKASEGVVIEGKNSVTLDNVELIDTNNKLNGQSTTYKNIFLYQSMSGDADNGTAEFTSKNSTIITNKGDTLYVTNTTASITLENNIITNNDNTGNFLRIQKDSWGNSGNNGGVVTLNLTNQNINGNIVVDSISKLTMNMSNNSYYEGKINTDNTAKEITLKLDKTSKIKLTGDTYITSLENSDSSNSNIDFNGYKLYVNNKSIN